GAGVTDPGRGSGGLRDRAGELPRTGPEGEPARGGPARGGGGPGPDRGGVHGALGGAGGGAPGRAEGRGRLPAAGHERSVTAVEPHAGGRPSGGDGGAAGYGGSAAGRGRRTAGPGGGLGRRPDGW